MVATVDHYFLEVDTGSVFVAAVLSGKPTERGE